MSAIAGIVQFDGRPNAAENVRSMAARMSELGPDGSGLWDGRTVALGHLMEVNTPEDRFERLPICSADGKVVLTGMFRLDNRSDLFGALNIPHNYRQGMSDGELVLKAYERWGDESFVKLYGDFAMAIWNQPDNTLVLVSDFCGTQNIFFNVNNARVAFATCPRALFSLRDIPQQLDENAFVLSILTMRSKMKRKPACFFKGIEGVPGGFFYKFSAKGVYKKRYWDPTSLPVPSFRQDQQWYDQFEELFVDAVRARLRQDRDTGILLSGGLDSAAVACVAAKLMAERGETLKTYTYRPLEGFDGMLPAYRTADEWPYVEMIAARYNNIESYFVRSENSTPLSHSEALLPQLESPAFVNVSWMHAICELAQQHNIGALLTGGAGNFSISYSSTSPRRKNDYLRRAIRMASRVLRYGDVRSLQHALRRRVFGSTPSFFRESVIEKYLDLSSDNTEWGLAKSMNYGDPDLLQKKWRLRSENQWSNIYDVYFRSYGMMAPDPSSDRRVVEFCITAPNRIFSKNGQDRLLIRHGLRDYIPADILNRVDRGAQSCDSQIHIQKNTKELHLLVSSFTSDSLAYQLLDFEKITDALMVLSAPHAEFSYSQTLNLWRVLCLLDFVRWFDGYASE